MFPKQKVIPEQDFVIAKFQSKHLSAQLKQWREENLIGVAMSCARQVWYGVGDDFKNFPYKHSSEISLLKGKEAYAFMLKLVVGMDSPKKGEVNIKGQFYKSWEKYKESALEDRAKKLDVVMQHLKADSRAVQTEILSQYKTHEHCLVARDLMGKMKGNVILLVGNVNKKECMSDFTNRVVNLAVSKNQRVQKILITHPDKEVAENLFKQSVAVLNSLKVDASLLEEIDFYDDLPSCVERSNHVFIDTVMGENERADSYIIETWRGRERQDNIMSHLRGNPFKMGLSNALWVDGKLQNFIFPEEIKMAMAERGRFNT